MTPAAIKNCLAAELTSTYSGTGAKYKCNSPLHCRECFRMTKTSAIIVIILLGLAGYEMIITKSALRASLVIIISYPARPRGIIVIDIYIYICIY